MSICCAKSWSPGQSLTSSWRLCKSAATSPIRSAVSADRSRRAHSVFGAVADALGRCLGQARDLGAVAVEIVLEPKRKRVRLPPDAAADLLARQERDVGDLGRIGPRFGREPPEIDVDELVLLHAVVELGAVTGKKAERQRGANTKLLVEPAARGGNGALTRPRMAAAGIRPQAA